jgi:hypothetical protein
MESSTPAQTPQTQVTLTDDERALARRLPDRVVYVGVVHFFNGPRGGRYRPVRTQARPTEAGALRELERLRNRAWKQCPSRTEMVVVDRLSETVMTEQVW